MTCRQGLVKTAAGRQMDVEVQRFGRHARHRAGYAMTLAGDDRHRGAGIGNEARQIRGSEIAVPRITHLVAGGQIEPELETLHQPGFLLRQLGMDQAAAGGHPLRAARPEQAFVAGAVTVPHPSGNHVGDRFEAAMRMIGKAAEIVLRMLVAEGIEHQEGIQPALQIRRQHPGQANARAVGGRPCRRPVARLFATAGSSPRVLMHSCDTSSQATAAPMAASASAKALGGASRRPSFRPSA
jgi:hypothetical protein